MKLRQFRCSGGARRRLRIKASLSVYDVGVAVDDARCLRPAGLDAGHHLLQRLRAVEPVAGVQKEDVVAGGQAYGLVHGVVEPFVGFAAAYDFVGRGRHAVAFLIVVDGGHRTVL